MAESFGIDAARYDRTRPRYPAGLITRIAAASPGPDVLDVGCGSGIAARQLQAAGCRVLGLDVDPRMAEFARGRGTEVEVAGFEAWDAADRMFDAVVAGQSWHWIDPVAGAAKAARLLRPRGLFAAFWNVGLPPEELRAAFTEVHRRILPDDPLFQAAYTALDPYSPILVKAAGGIRAAGVFGDSEEWRFEWQQPYTREEWLAQVDTSGFQARLTADQSTRLRDGIGAAIDAVGGGFTADYTTIALTAVRQRCTHHECTAVSDSL